MSGITVWGGSLATSTPQFTRGKTEDEVKKHRSVIAFDVRVVLSAYFQPHEDEKVKAAQLAWWCDALEDWPHESVVYALRKWNLDNPRLRPTPGDIVSMMKRLRGEREAQRKRAAPDPKQERPNVERISPERSQQILEEMGMTRARLNAVQGKEDK